MLATLIIAALLVLVITALAPPIIFPKPALSIYGIYITSYWRLDEESGIRFDMKGPVDLTNGGTAVTFTTGVITNAAASFNEALGRSLMNGLVPGTNQGPVTLQLTNNSWTMFTWVWPVDDGMGAAPPYGVCGKWLESGNTEYAFVIEANSKATIKSIGNNGFDTPTEYFVTTTNIVTANAWNFMVATYNLTTLTLSISLNNSPFVVSNPNVPSNWSHWAPMRIGGIDSITWIGLNGHQDETAIFKGYAFTQADVAYWWNGGAGRDPTVPCGFTR